MTSTLRSPSVAVLADRRDATAEANIPAAGGRHSLLQGCMNSGGDEVERGAALHHDGRPGVMRQHEHRHVCSARPPTPSGFSRS
jgi:hypothetical protein